MQVVFLFGLQENHFSFKKQQKFFPNFQLSQKIRTHIQYSISK